MVESLDIVSSTPPSLQGFYEAWAEAFLGDCNADPVADSTANGIANLWEFVWARDTANPHFPIRQRLASRVGQKDGSTRFLWDVPDVEDVGFHLEATGDLREPWQQVPHTEEPSTEVPGWIRLGAPPFDPADRFHFYRLVLSADLD